MKRVRIAVVGAGVFGRHHIRLLASHPQAELVAVADPSPAARAAVAEQFGVETCEDPRDVVSRVDAAVLAVPTRLHHELGCELLASGLHLLIEKPLAATSAEADELVATAERHRRVLQVGHIERFNPALEVTLPRLGKPKFIEARRTAPHRFRSTDIGVVLDLMIHDLDVVLSLTDAPVERVEALGLALFGRHEDVAQARLMFADGCIAQLTASRASYEVARVMHVWSEAGFAAIDFGNRVTTLVSPAENVRQQRVDAEQLSASECKYLEDHLFDELLPIERIETPERNQLLAELDEFLAAVQAGRQPRVSGEQGRRAIQVADRILAAIDQHAWDAVPNGRFGPHLGTRSHVLEGPHWLRRPAAHPRRREAG